MADSTIAEYLVRRRRSRRAWLAYLIPGVLLILRATFEFAFDGVTAHVVSFLSRITGDDVRLMAEAGWLTVALLPLALVVGIEDHRNRDGRITSTVALPDDTGVIHMTTRVRSEHGHGIARRPVAHWIKRIPLLLAFALAVLFWPLTGASMASHWTATPGGVAFETGWRVSLVAVALCVLVVLAEPWIVQARPVLTRAPMRLFAFVLPVAALGVTLILTR